MGFVVVMYKSGSCCICSQGRLSVLQKLALMDHKQQKQHECDGVVAANIAAVSAGAAEKHSNVLLRAAAAPSSLVMSQPACGGSCRLIMCHLEPKLGWYL